MCIRDSLYPWTVEKVVEYVGHEMEPGHLTYFEKRLQTMIDTCWPEMSIVSQFSTSNAFGEGSARHAISMSFENSVEKLTDFEREIIFKMCIRDRDVTVVIIDHHMDVIMAICDQISVLNFGTLLAEGRPEEIQNNPDVISAYLGVDE